MTGTGPLRCPCAGRYLQAAWTYGAPPEGETRFPALEGVAYRREVLRCDACAHYVSRHDMDLGGIYDGAYVDATYGERMRETFERIVSLPPERSDNHGRVRRVVEAAGALLRAPMREGRPPAALDVGSGLCVFLHGLARHGWRCTALDPDPRAARHAREVVGVDAIAADALRIDALGPYDLVALNKVAEHVPDPVALLERCAACLHPEGLLYIEVPDGDAAAAEGPGREEFFIEHHHAFSPASLALAAARAGLSPVRIERLHEPSGKYTLAAFCTLAPAGQVA